MPSYKVAHLREQGQDMLIFPLASGVHNQTDREKNQLLGELERRANAAGLRGSAVIIWEHGRHTHFMGPTPWHPFLRSLSMHTVLANVNREVSW